MNRTTQTQSQRSTNLKLSAAMTRFLKAVGRGKFAMPCKNKGLMRTFEALRTRNLVETTTESTARYLMVRLTALGCDVLVTLSPAPIEDELPAKMPMPTLMDADTAPVMEETPAQEPAIGDSVRYTYNTDNTVKKVFSGEIVDIKHSTVLNSIMYRVQPDADERLAYLGAVWIMPYQLEGQAHLDPVCDQLATLRKIEAAYLKWEAAYLAGRFEEAAKLDMIHRKLEDEHRERLYGPRRPCPKNAPQSPQNGPNGDIEAIQAYMRVMGTETPPIAPASEKTLNLEGLTWWQRDEARAAYWSKKSVAQIREGYTPLPDAETLKVKRDAQYAEAKARVDANVKRVMGGGA